MLRNVWGDFYCRSGLFYLSVPTNDHIVKAVSSNNVWMWELENEEGREPRNCCFWTVVLENTLESPLESKEIKPVNLKGNQPWILFGRTDAEAEAPILWPPDMNSWFTGKDPNAGKNWRQEEKGMTEDETTGWHHWFNGLELGQTLRVGEGQGCLACCSPWGHEESDTTWWLNNNSSASDKKTSSSEAKSHWFLSTLTELINKSLSRSSLEPNA